MEFALRNEISFFFLFFMYPLQERGNEWLPQTGLPRRLRSTTNREERRESEPISRTNMAKMTQIELEDLADVKIEVLKEFLNAQPPIHNGEKVLEIWSRLYCDTVKSVVVETIDGPSDVNENPVHPYEQLEAIVGDGHNWKWPRMWQHLDEIERRGSAFREGEAFNFGQPNKNENIINNN